MARTEFENLRVYQLAERFGDEVWRATLEWDHFARSTLGNQLVRAADSIGANIAEGAGRGSFSDNKRFARMARASLYESKHWLRQAYRRGLLASDKTAVLKELVDQLGPMLNAYIRSIGTATRTKATSHPTDH